MLLQSVRIDRIPETIEDFAGMREDTAVTPQGAVSMLILAFTVHSRNEELGRQMIETATGTAGSDQNPSNCISAHDLALIRSQLSGQACIQNSYFRGATPGNGYEIPPPPFFFDFTCNDYSGDPVHGPFKVFVACSGADSPRPVTAKRSDDGVWIVTEWSSLLLGVRSPSGCRS